MKVMIMRKKRKSDKPILHERAVASFLGLLGALMSQYRPTANEIKMSNRSSRKTYFIKSDLTAIKHYDNKLLWRLNQDLSMLNEGNVLFHTFTVCYRFSG